jgi:UDP-2,3-diacylglucosamine hydrolase
MHLLDAVQAPGHWRTVDFISDLHLQASEPATFEAWRTYMQHASCDALFILGDLFEVWVGDDLLEDPTEAAFPQACVQALHAATQRMPVYFMAGNRDFLVGERLLAATGMQGLSDPCTLTLGNERWVLSHGDALCLGDTDYQSFRRQVRAPTWQAHFLAQPLSQRLAMARQIRQASEQRKGTQITWADVDTAAAAALLQQHSAVRLIHGHTHQAAEHPLTESTTRCVLSDWDASSTPPRLEVLRWTAPTQESTHIAPARITIKKAPSA